jgi:hypothetical protein
MTNKIDRLTAAQACLTQAIAEIELADSVGNWGLRKQLEYIRHELGAQILAEIEYQMSDEKSA